MLSKVGTIFRRDKPSPSLSSEKEKLEKLKQKCDSILLKVRTQYPFDFFPDDVIIDSAKVNIIVRDFFATEQIHCIPIKSIIDISVEHSAFFAILKILPNNVMKDQVVSVRNLKKEDAIRARNIIQGLILADKENISVEHILQYGSVEDIEHLGKPSG